MKLATLEDLDGYRAKVRSRSANLTTIAVCADTGCRAYKSMPVLDAINEELDKQRARQRVEVKAVGCHGFCAQGPVVIVFPDNFFYAKVKPEDVSEILEKALDGSGPVERLLCKDPQTKKRLQTRDELSFYQTQMRLVFDRCGRIDPTSIDDYIAEGGYSALATVLKSMTCDEVIDQVDKSGLRGRGGGGFATARKWRSCRAAHGYPKYVIINADEGDPGAFMDRSLLEGDPHSVLEGLLIGAYAIGSDQGYIYVREEYPRAIEHFGIALDQARAFGLLGKGILGYDFNFDVQISRGGGAFVCGESTALMASIEGRPGEPRVKHIHTVESGLWEKPTNLNNVETWATVPLIINKGGDEYSQIGTTKAKGTKAFSLVGKVQNTGLIEVPLGMTVRDVVFGIGGGIEKGRKFKAVQTGGPSGGCVPEQFLDLPVEYESLSEVGSMMGSGGMIVMDERSCMVDVARYFIAFLVDESCGKCVPCREGLVQMLDILTRITEGNGQDDDVARLEELGGFVKNTALCGLGKSAPNPVLSTLKYFPEEYETHIRDKKCLSGVCKQIVTFEVAQQECKMCNICKKNCPADTIEGEQKEVPYRIVQDGCTKCGVCFNSCPFDAIKAV
jgi:NADH-quinone oxidoreductase subunit F